MARAVAASLIQTRLDFANSVLIGTSAAMSTNFSVSKTVLPKWYFKIFPTQLPASYHNYTGFQSPNEFSSKLQRLRTFSQPTHLSSVSSSDLIFHLDPVEKWFLCTWLNCKFWKAQYSLIMQLNLNQTTICLTICLSVCLDVCGWCGLLRHCRPTKSWHLWYDKILQRFFGWFLPPCYEF